MKTYDVVPGVGVGPVRFGMLRDEVRRVMRNRPVSFSRAGKLRHETDAFCNNGFQISYAGDEPRVEFIELCADSGFAATYRGKDVFLTRADDLVEFISRETPCDGTHPELGRMYVFPEIELALWRSFVPESENESEGQVFQTIAVGSAGYFSKRIGNRPDR